MEPPCRPLYAELGEWVPTALTARSGPRQVVTAPEAPYLGAVPGPEDLLPGPGARLSETTLAEWLARACGATRRRGPDRR